MNYLKKLFIWLTDKISFIHFRRLWNDLKFLKDGWLKQDDDARDYIYGTSFVTNEDLPESVDISYLLPSPKNQLTTNACTGFGSAAMVEALLYLYGYGRHRIVSPLYIWYWGKTYHGWETENKGVWLRYTLKAINEHGWVLDKSMPFKEDYLRAPDESVNQLGKFGLFHLNSTAYYLLGANDVKSCLNDGYPIVFGINLNKSFYGNRTGIISNEQPIPYHGHCMLVCGYDDNKQAYKVYNSWGRYWGDKGYCWIPYEYFNNNADDLWTIRYKEEK